MKKEPIKNVMKEGKKVFEGLGIAFSVMIAAIGFFTFLFLAASAIRTFLENRIIENAITHVQKENTFTSKGPSIIASSTEALLNLKKQEHTIPTFDFGVFEIKTEPTLPSASSDEYSYQTFADFFSGVGWIDTAQTSLVHDRNVSAFVLPSKFEWTHADNNAMIRTEYACIQDECYTVRGLSLFKENREIPLPEEVRGRTILTLSVAALDTQWRVGVVTRENDTFNAWVYAFNGEQFKNVRKNGPLFSSNYVGTIGMGGNDTEWLLVYGGYDGKAVQFLSNGNIVEIPNIFHMRLMDGGFVPGVSKMGNGDSATWFVWSKQTGKPRFIKLFQNGKSIIDGAADLSSSISSNIGAVQRFVCERVTREKALRCNADIGGVTTSWNFNDYGFDNSKRYTVVSANISNNILPVRRGSMSYSASDGGGTISVFLSNDGVNWEPADENKEVLFKNTEANRIFWKMEYIPSSDSTHSIFLKSVKLDFKLKK